MSKKQYRDPDDVSMGSDDDEIYRDAPDMMDDLMDANGYDLVDQYVSNGYDLVDQYVSNVSLSNELTKSTVLTIAMMRLTYEPY